MSMYPRELGTIPEETARVARAACPKGTLAMRLRDALGELYQDEQFVALYPVEGQPAYAPWRLAVVTVLQYTENLTDRQAANAVRERIDWKYSLGLELTDPGFDFSLLSEFRTRLADEGAETLLLDRLLEVCKQRGWLKAGGKQRTDSTHVLARVRSLSNLECVGETLRATLDDLAQLAPEWLVRQISPDWFERYSHRVENYRLPKAESQRTALAQQIGADGVHLLQSLEQPDAPAELKDIASVQMLRQVWQQYYDLSGGKAKWRAGPQESSDEGIIRSPYDPEARTGKKRETTWFGYKVHLTETWVGFKPAHTWPDACDSGMHIIEMKEVHTACGRRETFIFPWPSPPLRVPIGRGSRLSRGPLSTATRGWNCGVSRGRWT